MAFRGKFYAAGTHRNEIYKRHQQADYSRGKHQLPARRTDDSLRRNIFAQVAEQVEASYHQCYGKEAKSVLFAKQRPCSLEVVSQVLNGPEGPFGNEKEDCGTGGRRLTTKMPMCERDKRYYVDSQHIKARMIWFPASNISNLSARTLWTISKIDAAAARPKATRFRMRKILSR